MDGLSHLTQRDAVELATAWASSRAKLSNVRSLVLKGPIAATQLLRTPKLSADVDLLIEPGGLAPFLENVAHAGWIERERTSAPRIIDWHSVTLVHPDWPVDLDMHMTWPGFMIEDKDAFERLWESRHQFVMASVEVEAPSFVDSSLILALHALRNQRLMHSSGEVRSVAAAVARQLGENAAELVLERAILLGATQTARPFLERLGLVVDVEYDPSPELIRWQLNSSASSNTDAWLWQIMNVPRRKRPLALARALFPTPKELRVAHPDLPMGVLGLVKGWVVRLGLGMRELPGALKSVAAARRDLERPA